MSVTEAKQVQGSASMDLDSDTEVTSMSDCNGEDTTES